MIKIISFTVKNNGNKVLGSLTSDWNICAYFLCYNCNKVSGSVAGGIFFGGAVDLSVKVIFWYIVEMYLYGFLFIPKFIYLRVCTVPITIDFFFLLSTFASISSSDPHNGMQSYLNPSAGLSTFFLFVLIWVQVSVPKLCKVNL